MTKQQIDATFRKLGLFTQEDRDRFNKMRHIRVNRQSVRQKVVTTGDTYPLPGEDVNARLARATRYLPED